MLSSINLPGGVQVSEPAQPFVLPPFHTRLFSDKNLPFGKQPIQRRKLESDELQMRTFFQEGDLLVAEVQAFFGDGAMSLHTRSLRYGKVRSNSPTVCFFCGGRTEPRKFSCSHDAQLKNGLLVTVPPSLIVRAKSHFHTLPTIGVDLIIGLNGYIWISKTVKKETRLDGEEVGFGEESGEGVYSGENEVRVFSYQSFHSQL
mgnify:FL=1|jgi:exosome complex component RRP4